MSVVQKALWTIERNLGADLSLDALAQGAGVSRHHLAHAFGAATGVSPMTYVRRRRLTEAARGLANGAPDILSVALDAKYESHEAFTRAFKEAFGITPADARRDGIKALNLTGPLAFAAPPPATLKEPLIKAGGPYILIGLKARQSFERAEEIPAQWGRFMRQYGEIENIAEEIPVGVSFEPDEDDGGFDYACAVIVRSARRIPEGLTRLDLPAQTYAVFEHDGHVSTIQNTYAAIWDGWFGERGYDLADAANLEKHKPNFDTRTGLGGVEIWIPVKPRG